MPTDLLGSAVASVNCSQVRVAVDRVYFRPRLDGNVRFCTELLDQVVRHALFQGLASNDKSDLAGMVGKIQRRLTGRISGTDEVDIVSVHAARFAARGAVIHPLADQPIKAINGETPP